MSKHVAGNHSLPGRAGQFLCAIILLVPTFVAAQTRPLFNLNLPSTTQSPFPTDRFTVNDPRQDTGVRVNLPTPNCATNPSDCADVALLNQLDGFNLQPRISIPFDGAIDPATVSSKTVFLVELPARFRPGSELDGDAFAGFKPNIIGINQIVWDPASLTLFAESDQHLDQQSNYLLVVTRGIHDASGAAILRAQGLNSGDDGGDSQLRAYLRSLKSLLRGDVLHAIAPGLNNGEIAAASLFTTESATATLQSIRDQIRSAAAPQVSFTIGSNGEKTVFPVNTVSGFTWNQQTHTTGPLAPANLIGDLAALQVFPGSVGTIAFGKFNSKQWTNAGVFIPAVPTRNDVPVQSTQDVFFNLFIPSGKRPSTGWPVAIFGHGFTDSKQGAPFAVASTLAHNGIASIAINVVGHGFGPNSTLTINQGATSVTFPEGGRGIDQDGNGVITSSEGSSTFFASPQGTIGSRDALQQTVADMMQLVRAIQGGIDADGDGLPDLDANRIYYAGQSFGGIYGTIFMGIEPDIRAGVPNVPGGAIIDIVRLSPSFQLLLTQALAVRTPNLLNAGPPIFFNDNSPLRNLPTVINNVPGAVAIQTVEDSSRWLGQAGDPVAWAPFIRKSPLLGESSKSVIIQFARGDETVPNPTATALIRSGDLADRATFFRNDLAFALGVGFGKNPHTFLTNIGGTVPVATAAIGAQTQIAIFFATDGALTIDPDGPGPLFEVPIAGPLPEDLGFLP
jgi:Bacterial virulence factor lipase N-terminal